jgi:subtilase family serine protease
MRLRKGLGAALAAVVCFASMSAATSFAAERAAVNGRVASTEQVSFDVYLPLEHAAQLEALLTSLNDPSSASYHKWLTPAEFHKQFGTSAATLAAVKHELEAHGLTAVQVTPQKFHVTGTAHAVELMFATQLHRGVYKNGRTATVAVGGTSMPSMMAANGAVVVGLEGFIRAHRHATRLAGAVEPQNRYSPDGPYWFDDLKQAYGYPSYQSLNGSGVTIGVLMANGFNPADMANYFGHEKLAVPHMTTVNVDGGAPYNPDLSFETHLDLQQTGGMAPQANLVLYNIPDLSDAHIIDGLITILESNQADVVNMSFGGAEIGYTAAYNNGVDFTGILGIYDDVFKQGNAQGITFVSSSGDLGSNAVPAIACFDPKATNGCGGFEVSVETPAVSPHVTGVGGTNLVTTFSAGSLDSNYVSEAAFGDPLEQDIFYGTPATGGFWGSGGGVSIYFRRPGYQYLVNTGSRMRTVPDVSLHMGGCPIGSVLPCGPDRSADIVAIDGKYYGVIGTSASSPDFAGLLALKVQQTGGRLGNENYAMYMLAALQSLGGVQDVFHDDISGDNGLYTTHKGYNYVLGNGTVDGVNYLLAPQMPTAGTPQTERNP